MKTIKTMAEALTEFDGEIWDNEGFATAILKSIHEPDPHVVAAVADKLKMDATKVAAVWMLMVEFSLDVPQNNVDKLKDAYDKVGYWKCDCGLMHPKDYVCTMLKDN